MIAHPHHEISEILPQILEKILISIKKPNGSPQKSAQGQDDKKEISLNPQNKQEQNNEKNRCIYILLIDDVIGDYSKKFFPFYVWLKKEFMAEGVIPVIRGIAGPEKLIEYLSLYPFDVVLIDIDFEKHFKEEISKSNSASKVEFDKSSYYYRVLEEIIGTDENRIDENCIKEKGPLILGFIILEQLISLLRTGVSKINDKDNCDWYILTSYKKKIIEAEKTVNKETKSTGNKEKLELLQERWIEKEALMGEPKCIIGILKNLSVSEKNEELFSLRNVLKFILASKYVAIEGHKLSGLIKAFGISTTNEKELLEVAKEIETNLGKIKEDQIIVYSGEEKLDENDFINYLNNTKELPNGNK